MGPLRVIARPHLELSGEGPAPGIPPDVSFFGARTTAYVPFESASVGKAPPRNLFMRPAVVPNAEIEPDGAA